MYIRKTAVPILLAAIIALAPLSSAASASNVIHRKVERENVTSGVTLDKITMYTVDGWIKANVLTVDLTDPNVKVDVLCDSGSVINLSTTLDLARNEGAVAAVNAGFFEWDREPGGSGRGYYYGTLVKSGQVVMASNSTRSDLATLTISRLNEIIYDYLKTEMYLMTSWGQKLPVSQYNRRRWDSAKSAWDYSGLTVLDRKWGNTSIGASQNYPNLAEMVVKNGRVVEIRVGKPAVTIPGNGYVVVTNGSGVQTLQKYFAVGDYVDFIISTKPAWQNAKISEYSRKVTGKPAKC